LTKPPLISIVGRSKSGKTTLLEKLIPEFTERGYRVGTIKHHFHSDETLDTPGKDTHRHAQAGAERVILVSPLTTVTFDYHPQPPSLQEVAARMADFDLVLTEGFSRAGLPAIEVLRAARTTTPIPDLLCRLAIAADFPVQDFDPVLNLNDIPAIADFIARYIAGLPGSQK
jgi:molybdopterin-guanine dinucleotide biosynthesis protein MobB